MEVNSQNTAAVDAGNVIPGTDAGTGGTGVDAVAGNAAPATGNAAPAADAAAPTVAKAPKKTELCEAIFLRMVAQKKTRQEILAAFKAEADMTQDGASTYYANNVRKHGISGEKSVRAAKPTDATAAAPGAAAPKTPRTPRTKAGGTTKVGDGTAPTFAVVGLVNGAVAAVQPFYSQLSAVKSATDKPTVDIGGVMATQIVVQGVPAIGDTEAALNVLKMA